jgi:D-arabinose 1-dehydrogenase-like Zn-dependent alcohol dehydrogenase
MIRKVSSDHQQEVAVHHRVIAGGKSQQSGHTHVEWVVISGEGGLGQMAVKYAVAMELHVVAVDVDDSHLDLTRKVGAKVTVNDRNVDLVAYIQKEIGGGHGALVTKKYCLSASFTSLKNHIQLLLLVAG